jgi:hypothetical protein
MTRTITVLLAVLALPTAAQIWVSPYNVPGNGADTAMAICLQNGLLYAAGTRTEQGGTRAI